MKRILCQCVHYRSSNQNQIVVALFAAAILCLSLPIQAALLLLEGPVSDLTDNGDGSGSITVMGVTVTIPSGLPITTPTAILTIGDVADPTPLPGRTQGGFLGGTAIIEGTGDVGAGYTADSLFLEPAENILGAEVTTTVRLSVSGVPLEATNDPRIPNDPFTNAFGFEVDPTTVPVGRGVVSEGYFSNDGTGVMKYFAIEVEAGDLVNAGVTEVSITRAQCLEGDPGDPIELRVQGATHDPGTGSVLIVDTNNPGTVFGTEPVAADIPPFGLYRFRLKDDPTFTVCPTSVTVVFINGATAVSAVN